jgi:leader peptidase (prepilin peptidase) / N-methyltransferase
MSVLIYCLVFVLGACWGSFLNCLIYRWEQGKKINNGRSFCPKCHHQLGFFDLVPVFSFIFLRRKCRYCQEKIAWQYLIVEIATGLLFLIIFNFYFSLPAPDFNITAWVELFYLWFVASCLMVIFIYDLKHYLIPDQAVCAAIAAVFLERFMSGALSFGYFSWLGAWQALKIPLMGAILASGFFFLIWLVSRGKWMGFGDVKLAFLLGLFLSWPNVLLGLFIAFFTGALIGVTLMLFGRKKMQSQVPFGPFLIFGAFIALFYGTPLINWYLNLLWR